MRPILVIHCFANQCRRWQFNWQPEISVQDILAQIDEPVAYVAVARFGIRVSSEDLLQPGDRLELLGPLLLDPKTSRKERVRQARARRRAQHHEPAPKTLMEQQSRA